MARDDLHVFEEFAAQLGAENHILDADVIKVGIITNAGGTPSDSLATPTWGDFSANEVAQFVGGYVTGGIDINATYSEAGGVGTLDGDNIALTTNGSGFDDAYFAIIYNDDNATDMAIAWVDLGGAVSQIAGPVNINWDASGILTITVTPFS